MAWEQLEGLTEHDGHKLLGLQGRLQLSASHILHLHAQAGGQGGAGDDGEKDEERAHAAITSYQSAHSSQVTLERPEIIYETCIALGYLEAVLTRDVTWPVLWAVSQVCF